MPSSPKEAIFMKIQRPALVALVSTLLLSGVLQAQITGVTAGTDLTGGGTGGNVTLNLDTTKVPRLAAANAFSGNQSVKGNVTATGTVAGNMFAIGSNLFGFGSVANASAFVGFSGNTASTGTNNTGDGYHALFSNTNGGGNTAIGSVALYANQTGSVNTAVGAYALYNNLGGQNTAIGEQALVSNTTGDDNTATGYLSLSNNVGGGSNTAFGEYALDANDAGNNNTAVGVQAGGGVTGTSSSNTFLGYLASNTVNPINNSTAIGANALVGENNALILGATGKNAVAVGIGTATPYPDYGLDIETVKSNGVINGGVVVNASGGNLYLGMTNTVHKFRVDTNGAVYADGGFLASGADFAESVSVRGERSLYKPGDLLEIASGAHRTLALSHSPYSTRIAGIYSTKPGVLGSPHAIDEKVEGEVPLAIVGIVPCNVTAENGAIHEGDLLVASSRPGFAMKGTDRSRLVGAVVGKALESLPKGTGSIQVLVTLQ
jgi:hypothetical protein